MHAVVLNVSIPDRAVAEAELAEIVPRVSGAPGFVAGFWVVLPGEKGMSVAVFETQAAAQEQVAGIEAAPAGAVAIDSVALGEVIAHA